MILFDGHFRGKSSIHSFDIANLRTRIVDVAQIPVRKMLTDAIASVECGKRDYASDESIA